jgi:hypothetical protein
MAKIQDNPKVQAIMTKEAEKAAKAQDKAVSDTIKAAVVAAKGAMDEQLESAKLEEEPAVAKALKRHLGEARKLVIAAIKGE